MADEFDELLAHVEDYGRKVRDGSTVGEGCGRRRGTVGRGYQFFRALFLKRMKYGRDRTIEQVTVLLSR